MLVKGIERSGIYDLQRKKVFLIPNTLYDLFGENSGAFHVPDIQAKAEESSRQVLIEYIDFLKKNELAFYCTEQELAHFPPLNDQYLFPAHISNCILDAKGRPAYLNEAFLLQLEQLCCNHIQLRLFGSVSLDTVKDIVVYLSRSQIRSIELVCPCPEGDNFETDIRDIITVFRKIRSLILYNAPRSCLLKKDDLTTGSIYLSAMRDINNLHCGIIQPEQFAVNIPHYTESLRHNTCLNRKVAIDIDGNIKNCPGMKESFGNISDTTLPEAVSKPGFKKYWNIKKDDIVKCSDCEFRHICTDCRAYLENPDDIYSAPLKCGYNPYTCTWEEWSENPLKQKAIDYYGMGTIGG